jgi:hypothetical protein
MTVHRQRAALGWRTSFSALLLALAFVCASTPACNRAEPRPHESLTGDAEPLRSAFNADAGKPRIVILAAPT